MGLIDKLFGRDPYPVPSGTSVDVVLFEGDGDRMEVVGESHYQGALRKSWNANNTTDRDRRVDCFAVLQPQPNNKHDSNAVGVYTVPGGLSGHLPREEAARWHSRIAAAWKREGKPIAVPAEIHTKSGDLFGVWLDWPNNFRD